MSTDIRTLFDPRPEDVALTTDDWYTPRWLFDAAGLVFDMDVCAPVDPTMRTCPAREYLTVVEDGLTAPWRGLVWMNPPYSDPGPWARRFVNHGSGLALVGPVRSSWAGPFLQAADAIALLTIAFIQPGREVATYRTLLLLAACGVQAVEALAKVAKADPCAQGAYYIAPRTIP